MPQLYLHHFGEGEPSGAVVMTMWTCWVAVYLVWFGMLVFCSRLWRDYVEWWASKFGSHVEKLCLAETVESV